MRPGRQGGRPSVKLCQSAAAMLTLAFLSITNAPEAQAQSASDTPKRDYCPDRPSLGTPSCTIEAGRVAVEIGLAQWTRDTSNDLRTDTSLVGDTLVRVGLSDNVEGLFGWTAFGHERTRDKRNGQIEKANRVGDVLLGFKANLREPDGSGFSVAVQPYLTLPVGRTPIGAGDWGAGVIAPVSFDLSSALNLQFTPEIEAAVDQDGNGRHLSYGSVVGLEVDITDTFNITFEIGVTRDNDPEQKTTQALSAISVGWMAAKDFQFDVGAVLGINHAAPDVQVSFGVARLF